MALEPQWETLFENNSYRNRIGRTSLDAVEAIFLAICNRSKITSNERFIFKAKVCLENLQMDSFIQKLKTISSIEKMVPTW